MKFRGRVKKVCITNAGMKYSVIEINNKSQLNYTLFVPGEEFKLRQQVLVTVEATKAPKEVKSGSQILQNMDLGKIEARVIANLKEALPEEEDGSQAALLSVGKIS